MHRAAERLAKTYQEMDDIQQKYPGNTIGKDEKPTRLWDDQMAEINTIISEKGEWHPGDAERLEKMARHVLGSRGRYRGFGEQKLLQEEVLRLRERAAENEGPEDDVPEYVEWQDFDPDA